MADVAAVLAELYERAMVAERRDDVWASKVKQLERERDLLVDAGKGAVAVVSDKLDAANAEIARLRLLNAGMTSVNPKRRRRRKAKG